MSGVNAGTHVTSLALIQEGQARAERLLHHLGLGGRQRRQPAWEAMGQADRRRQSRQQLGVKVCRKARMPPLPSQHPVWRCSCCACCWSHTHAPVARQVAQHSIGRNVDVARTLGAHRAAARKPAHPRQRVGLELLDQRLPLLVVDVLVCLLCFGPRWVCFWWRGAGCVSIVCWRCLSRREMPAAHVCVCVCEQAACVALREHVLHLHTTPPTHNGDIFVNLGGQLARAGGILSPQGADRHIGRQLFCKGWLGGGGGGFAGGGETRMLTPLSQRGGRVTHAVCR